MSELAKAVATAEAANKLWAAEAEAAEEEEEAVEVTWRLPIQSYKCRFAVCAAEEEEEAAEAEAAEEEEEAAEVTWRLPIQSWPGVFCSIDRTADPVVAASKQGSVEAPVACHAAVQ